MYVILWWTGFIITDSECAATVILDVCRSIKVVDMLLFTEQLNSTNAQRRDVSCSIAGDHACLNAWPVL